MEPKSVEEIRLPLLRSRNPLPKSGYRKFKLLKWIMLFDGTK